MILGTSLTGDLIRWFFLTGMTDLVTTGIDIALFGLFGSLVWENLGAKLGVETEDNRKRRSIRTIAKYFLFSFVVLLGAYLVDFARGQIWITALFPVNTLTIWEMLILFCGYVMFVPPLYALGRVLNGPNRAIGDVILPNATKTVLSGMAILFYMFMVWWERSFPSMTSLVLELSCGVGIVLGIMILSFGKSRELTILGAGMISLAWGILIGYSISQTYPLRKSN